MPLTTVSLPSGVPTGDPLVWTGRVAETFSNAVYAKAFDNYLLSRVTRMPAASAFNLRRFIAHEIGEIADEGAALTETQITGEVQRKVLATHRAQQIVSSELLADSDAMQVVGNLLALELAEKVSVACADAIEQDLYNAATSTYRDNVCTGLVTNGAPTIAAMSAIGFGVGSTLNGLAAGARFTQGQRANLVYLMDGTTMREWGATTQTGNYGGHHAFEDGMLTFMGIPICTTVGLAGNADTSIGLLHVACVDVSQIILAEQPMVIAVDTESRAANNQVLITAAYRAAAFLSHRSHATGLTVRTMSGGVQNIVES